MITTLLDPDAYPLLDLVCGYHQRWEAEITFDEVDTHQRLLDRPLRSRSPVGVIQELYGLLIAHYVVRCLMYEAAVQADLEPHQLSFVNAVQVICRDRLPLRRDCEDCDDLRAARGVVIAIVYALIAWCMVAAVAVIVMHAG